MNISAVKRVNTFDTNAFVPPLSDYKAASAGWTEAEYRVLEASSNHVVVGFWTGERGSVTLDPWPYTEVCSILSGKVAVKDSDGAQIEFGVGENFIVPKGFVGEWITLEPSTKMFIAIS